MSQPRRCVHLFHPLDVSFHISTRSRRSACAWELPFSGSWLPAHPKSHQTSNQEPPTNNSFRGGRSCIPTSPRRSSRTSSGACCSPPACFPTDGARGGLDRDARTPRQTRPKRTFQATGLSHVALNVRSVSASRDWYIKHLGLKVITDGGEDNCFLGGGDGFFLTLFKGEHPD